MQNLDCEALLTTRTDQNQRSESDKPPWHLRVAEWNKFIRHRGRAYAGCRLDNFRFHGGESEKQRQRDAIQKLIRYGQTIVDRVKRAQGIVLVGPTGTGKDHIETALARHAILNHGFSVAYIDGASFFSQLRDRISEGLTERGAMRPLIEADILYLSDPVPASGELSNYQKDRLFDLINARGKKPNWVSCNFQTADEARDVLSPQLAGRLRDSALVLPFNWPSYRKPAPHDGREADEWWAPFDDDDSEPDVPADTIPAPTSPGGGFPFVNNKDLRDAATVEDIFRELVERRTVDEADRRGVFQAARQASLMTRAMSPASRFRELIEHRAWTGDDPNYSISSKVATAGDAMMAEVEHESLEAA